MLHVWPRVQTVAISQLCSGRCKAFFTAIVSHAVFKFACSHCHIYRVAQKNVCSLLINIFGINLNEISISGWECNIMFSQQMAQALLAGADGASQERLCHLFSKNYKSACAICWEDIILHSHPEIEISFKFIPKILMCKECIHFFGPLCINLP